jgi:hypothetical protein
MIPEQAGGTTTQDITEGISSISKVCHCHERTKRALEAHPVFVVYIYKHAI